jgi:hypothetical protein
VATTDKQVLGTLLCPTWQCRLDELVLGRFAGKKDNCGGWKEWSKINPDKTLDNYVDLIVAPKKKYFKNKRP